MMTETANSSLKSENARSKNYLRWTSAECLVMKSPTSTKIIMSTWERALCSTATSGAHRPWIKRQTSQLQSTISWDLHAKHHKPDHSRLKMTLKPALVRNARVFASPSLTRCFVEGAAAALQVSMNEMQAVLLWWSIVGKWTQMISTQPNLKSII